MATTIFGMIMVKILLELPEEFMKKLILVDGYSIAFRAFYAVPLLSNAKGLHTNVIYGIANMLSIMIEEEQPTHVLVAFDAGKTTFRHEFFPAYKEGRQETPTEFSEQIPFVKELLNAFGVAQYELEQYEADDIIGTVARQAEQEGFQVVIVSGDRDLTQLATEGTTVRITKKGVTETEDHTPSYIREKLGIDPLQIIDLKGLMGDSSDNIPGVPGIGEKTGLKLLLAHGSVENVLASIDQISGKKLVENLTNYREQAILSKQLATIVHDAPVAIGMNDLVYSGADVEKLRSFYREMEMNSLLKRLDAGDSSSASTQKDTLAEIDYQIVQEITADLLNQEVSAFYVEELNENYLKGDVLGFSLATADKAYYIPVDVAVSSELFRSWIADPTKQKLVFDVKKCKIVLLRLGMDLQGVCFDAMLASYVLNPSEKIEDFAAVARSFYDELLESDEQFYGKGAKLQIPGETLLSEHIVRKAVALWHIYQPMKVALEENDQYHLLTELEQPLALILADMEWQGVVVEADRLVEMGSSLRQRLEEIESDIFGLAGQIFNIQSPKQLGEVLFERLALPASKKTKTGYSTSAEVLEGLLGQHPIIEKILLYRQLSKLQSTYVEGLLKVIHSDGKVHTRFNQALTQTGRLSSLDPNLQNIPIRLEEGRKIRQAFVASEPDWFIFSADYSQIELRVMAHISSDERLIAAFNEGLDIHTKTAMNVFDVATDAVTADMRRQAKAVNFGIIY